MQNPDPDLIARLAPFHTDGTVVAWTARALRKAFRTNRTSIMSEDERIRHVVDWIAGGIASDRPWTRDIDDDGFPLKLTRFGSLEHAWRTADKMMRREAALERQSLVSSGAEVSGGETAMLLGGGWRMVRLATPKHLDFETAFMDHCIGGGAYDDKVSTGRSLFFSLRDPTNRPHVTIEIVDEGVLRVVQCWGACNTFPPQPCRPMLLAFFEAKEADYAYLAPMFGRIADTAGNLHDIGSIGPGFAAWGPVWFPPGTDAALPEETRIAGDVVVAGGAGIRFGAGTAIYGTLHLHPDSMSSLPDRLVVSRDLHAPGSGMTTIGDDTRIMGSVNLSDCPIETVGRDLVVGMDMIISGCRLPVLPKCWVSGVLVLGNGIGSIGDGVFCRSLDASDAELKRIGDDVSVTGRANLPATLEAIGRNFRTDKSLDVNCPRLSSLGEGFSVAGSFFGYETALSSLPRNCSIGRGLELPRSALTALPGDLRLGFAITERDLASERRPTFDMTGSMLSSLPEGFSYDGDVVLDGCPLPFLPSGMRVGGDLQAKNTPLRTIPDDLTVGSDLVLDGSPIERLPAGLTVSWLGLRGAPIAELPTGLVLRDGGNLSGTPLTFLPDDMAAGGDLVLPVEMHVPPGIVTAPRIDGTRNSGGAFPAASDRIYQAVDGFSTFRR